MSDRNGRHQHSPGRLATIISTAFLLGALAAGVPWLNSVRERRDAIDQIAHCRPTNGKQCADKSHIDDVRSANADEDAVDVAIIQAVLGVVGFVGLIYTVMYARGAWRATVEAERRELRAYVGIDKLEVQGLESGDLTIRAIVRNAGATPALNFKMITNVGCSALPIPNWNHAEEASPKSTGHLLPGSKAMRESKLKGPFPPNDLAMIKDGRAAIYCRGRVTYDDIFGDTHFTNFSAMMGGDLGGYPDVMMLCADGNECD